MGRILIGNIKGPQGAQGIQGPQGPVGATGPQGPMPDLINNALATQAGVAALDAVMGKTLQDQITQLNSDFLIKTFQFVFTSKATDSSGYELQTVDIIPDGYTGYVLSMKTEDISNLRNCQFTPIYLGNNEFYYNYYIPANSYYLNTTDATITVVVLCVRDKA